jgi:small-conductance mechanosensitive channel
MAGILGLKYTIGEFSISVYMVVMVALVIYLTSLVSWILQALADAHYMSPRKMDFGVKTAMKRLLHYALFSVGFFIAVSMAGLELQKFAIIAGALGVGIGFGLQNIVNNFVSGLILLFERPVKVGDTINIDDQWGTITRIGLRSTIFETLDRAEIIVPNSELISQKVINWTFTTHISRIVLTVGVAYGSPLSKVLGILMRVAQEHPDILNDPESSAIFTGFGDSSIDFELRVWVSDINKRLRIKSELGLAIDSAFREEDITIPFPQRDLHLHSIESKLEPIPADLSEKSPSEPQGPTE